MKLDDEKRKWLRTLVKREVFKAHTDAGACPKCIVLDSSWRSCPVVDEAVEQLLHDFDEQLAALTTQAEVMTKAILTSVFEELVHVIDNWNDAAADDDRGRDNDAIAIVLYDDGSGKVGTAQFMPALPGAAECSISAEQWFNEQHRFKTIDELVAYLAMWMEVKA